MQLKTKASLEFVNEPVAEKPMFGINVTNLTTDNLTLFPNLPVGMEILTGINGSLAEAIVAAKTGDHIAVATVTAEEKSWDSDFRQTANYVSSIANGSEVIIRSAGFAPTKSETQPAQLPEQPQAFDVNVNKAKGSFSVECRAVNGGDAYVYTAAPDGVGIAYAGNMMTVTCGDTQVFITVDTHRKVNFDNMPGGEVLNVSMYAVNRAGSGPATAAQQVRPQ